MVFHFILPCHADNLNLFAKNDTEQQFRCFDVFIKHPAHQIVIKYSMLLDSTLVASRLTWNKGGEETTKISYYNKEGQDVLEDFTGDSFIMETLYAPQENVLDKIWSKPVKYTK